MARAGVNAKLVTDRPTTVAIAVIWNLFMERSLDIPCCSHFDTLRTGQAFGKFHLGGRCLIAHGANFQLPADLASSAPFGVVRRH